jgi:hypothetical protein
MQDKEFGDQLDVLKHIENLTEGINREMSKRSGSILKRYPITFALLALFGIDAVSVGVKGILGEISVFEENPVLMLAFGLLILTVLGLLYKKLDK